MPTLADYGVTPERLAQIRAEYPAAAQLGDIECTLIARIGRLEKALHWVKEWNRGDELPLYIVGLIEEALR